MIDWDLLFRALGLAFVMEGLLWAAFPKAMRAMMAELIAREPAVTVRFGLGGIAVGLVILALCSWV